MSQRVEIPQSTCSVAVHETDITPPVGIYHRMWGAARHERAKGVGLPLHQTTLLLGPTSSQAPSAVVAMIAVDHCLLWPEEMQQLLEAIAERTPLEPHQITVFFSHTHAAGLMGLERSELAGGELIAPYLESLAENIALSIRHALPRMETGHIVYAKGHCDLARNRDHWAEQSNAFACGYNPEGTADDTVIAARITSPSHSQPLAIMVNYACHPTTLAWQNELISPDYIGGLRETIRRETGAPLFFIQGASGDTGPRESYVGDQEVARRNGRSLAFAVLSCLETAPLPHQSFEYMGPVVSGATLGTWDWVNSSAKRIEATSRWKPQVGTVELPFRNDLPQKADLEREKSHWQSEEESARQAGDDQGVANSRAMIERMTRRLTRVKHLDQTSKTFNYAFQVFEFGDAIWVALGGEHYNVLQETIRARFPDRVIVVGTLANGSEVWYVPDAESYGKGLYQEDASILAKGSLETLCDAVVRQIEQLLN